MKALLTVLAVSTFVSAAAAQDLIYTVAGSVDTMYVANSDLSSPVVLLQAPRRGYFRDPDLSPADNLVAVNDSGAIKLVSYDRNSGATSVVTVDSGGAEYPDFSLDGSKLVYSVLLDSTTRDLRIRDVATKQLVSQHLVPNGSDNFTWVAADKIIYSQRRRDLSDNDAVNSWVTDLYLLQLDSNSNVTATTKLLDSRDEEFSHIHSIEYSASRNSLLMTATYKVSLGGDDRLVEYNIASKTYSARAPGQRASLSDAQGKAIYRELVQQGKKSGYLVKTIDIVTGAIQSVTSKMANYEYFAW